jgi:hypothetical protein
MDSNLIIYACQANNQELRNRIIHKAPHGFNYQRELFAKYLIVRKLSVKSRLFAGFSEKYHQKIKLFKDLICIKLSAGRDSLDSLLAVARP